MHLICIKKVLIEHEIRDFFWCSVLMITKGVTNSIKSTKKEQNLHNCRKLIQIRCQKGAGTKMHKCLVGFNGFLSNCLYSRNLSRVIFSSKIKRLATSDHETDWNIWKSEIEVILFNQFQPVPEILLICYL